MRRILTGNLPPWEVLNLVAHHLDPKTLAVASCVSKSWFVSMSSDYLWQPICSSYYPSLTDLKIIDPSLPYRSLFSICYTATKRRLEPPPSPRISLDDIVFAVELRTKKAGDNNHNGAAPHFAVAKPANELYKDTNGTFLFRFDVGGVINCDGCSFGRNKLQEEVIKITWNVVLRGWLGVFTMMDFEGRMSFTSAASEGWFSEELPSPRCCSGEVASGIVADLKLGFSSGGGGEEVMIEKVCVGMLSIVDWRYVNVDDGLRYLQHFLLPNAAT